jgi:hypothetical protein
MVFRRGETREFPVDSIDRAVWYGTIEYSQEAGFTEKHYTSSKSGKADLLEMIRGLISDGQEFEVIGVWQGKWKTDLFILDSAVLVEMLGKFA